MFETLGLQGAPYVIRVYLVLLLVFVALLVVGAIPGGSGSVRLFADTPSVMVSAGCGLRKLVPREESESLP